MGVGGIKLSVVISHYGKVVLSTAEVLYHHLAAAEEHEQKGAILPISYMWASLGPCLWDLDYHGGSQKQV